MFLLSVITVTYEWYSGRDAIVRELSLEADIIAANSVVVLSFEAIGKEEETPLISGLDASDTLETLRFNEHIEIACIYAKSGNVLAEYQRGGNRDKCPNQPKPRHVSFDQRRVEIFRPIIEPDGETVGTVYVKSDLRALYARVGDYAIFAAIVAIACFLVAILLTVWLQGRLSSPLLSLAKTVRVVSEKRDYSLRAEGHSQDEVGFLIGAFNEMLGTIQEHESELEVLNERLGESNEKLAEYSASLEASVEKRTAELAQAMREAQEARDRAMEANRAKSQFLANMSHEIRTPMNAIIGLTDLTLRGELPERTRDALSKIRISARSLLTLINDILDFSKIEAGKMELEHAEFDLRVLLERLADLVSDQALRKGIELLTYIEPEVPCALQGDALRLSQVLTNLANNAVKFTEQGQIVIRVELAGPTALSAGDPPAQEEIEEEVRLRLSVEDSGIGIEEEMIPKLFESFTQADGTSTRKYGGSGLGLTICKRLVELMGGAIHVESERGKGSKFYFEVTLERRVAQEVSLVPPAKTHGLRILVVDDNEISCEILAMMLASFSFEVDVVHSGQAALDRLAEAATARPKDACHGPADNAVGLARPKDACHGAGGSPADNAVGPARPYDLVLLDWRMPGMDGLETANRIESDGRLLENIPKIIMVTAHDLESVREQSENAVLAGLLAKPVSHSVLFNGVMEALGHHEARVARATDMAHTSAGADETLRGVSVLLVEDHEINQEIAQGILEGAGVHVQIASNGQEAVEAVYDISSSFDAVLMDVQMPVMDGYEATRTIRADGRFDELPIIAITAHAMKGDRDRCLAAGMNDHVTKPIDVDELLSALALWVSPNTRPRIAICCGIRELPGINLEEALRRVGGNEKALRRILSSFNRSFAEIGARIKTAWDEGDLEKARRLAHGIKGVSGNISATTLFDATIALHEAIKEEAHEEFALRFDAFQAALDEVVDSLGTFSETMVGGKE